MAEEQTLVIIKPDGLKKSLTGNILTRLSETRLKIIAAKVVRVTKELAEKHYAHLKGQPYYEEAINYLQGKPYGKDYERVLVLVYKGENAISQVKKIVGVTNPEEAEPTSIRGAYGRIIRKPGYTIYENVIHCSGNAEEAKREIQMWFEPDEIVSNIYETEIVELHNIKQRVWKDKKD